MYANTFNQSLQAQKIEEKDYFPDLPQCCNSATKSQTVFIEFIWVGFNSEPQIQIVLSVLFLVMYVLILVVNMGYIVITTGDAQLQTPMYFFLKNLSFMDICYSTAITPKEMLSFSTGNKVISHAGCATHMLFFSLLGICEAFSLAGMAYSWFIAICNPLLYHAKMPKKICALLVIGSYFFGFLNCCTQTVLTFNLSYCCSKEINQFFCDVPAVRKASFSDTLVNKIVLLAMCGSIIIMTFLVILISNTYIVTTVLRIPSVVGKHQMFSTCISHIIVVSLIFGTTFFMYDQPEAVISPNQSKVLSVFYTIVISMLNSLIYCLRNNEVINALETQIKRMTSFYETSQYSKTLHKERLT